MTECSGWASDPGSFDPRLFSRYVSANPYAEPQSFPNVLRVFPSLEIVEYLFRNADIP
jgi:hypothetical protein